MARFLNLVVLLRIQILIRLLERLVTTWIITRARIKIVAGIGTAKWILVLFAWIHVVIFAGFSAHTLIK